MPTISPFTPQTAGTVNVTASTSSQAIKLATGGGTQARIYNTASVSVYIEFGASTAAASAGVSMPIGAATGTQYEMVTIPVSTSVGTDIYMAAVASVGTTLPIFATRGEGF